MVSSNHGVIHNCTLLFVCKTSGTLTSRSSVFKNMIITFFSLTTRRRVNVHPKKVSDEGLEVVSGIVIDFHHNNLVEI